MHTHYCFSRTPAALAFSPGLTVSANLYCTSPCVNLNFFFIIQGWEAAREKVSQTLVEVCGRGHDASAVKKIIRGM